MDKTGLTGKRIGAFVLDNIILYCIVFICAFISEGLGILALICGNVLYYGLCEGSSLHGSLGKVFCGLMVVDDSGRPLTYQKSFVRSICRMLSAMALGIGYLIGLFSADGRTLHDQLAHTRVVPRGAERSVVRHSDNGHPYLVAVTGQLAGQSFRFPGLEMVLGTNRSCTLVVYGPGISRRHCRIVYEPASSCFYLYDVGSSYGTYLSDGSRLRQGVSSKLYSGQEFWLGEPSNRFRVITKT